MSDPANEMPDLDAMMPATKADLTALAERLDERINQGGKNRENGDRQLEEKLLDRIAATRDDIITAISGPAADLERVLLACKDWAHVEIRTPQVSTNANSPRSDRWANDYTTAPGWIVRVSNEPLPVMLTPPPAPMPTFEIVPR